MPPKRKKEVSDDRKSKKTEKGNVELPGTLPSYIWPAVLSFIPSETVRSGHLFLVNKATNDLFIKDYLNSIKTKSRIFEIDDLPTQNMKQKKKQKKKPKKPKKKKKNYDSEEEDEDEDEDEEDLRDNQFEMDPKMTAQLSRQVKTRLPSWVRRGDVIHFSKLGDYRNDGKWVWDNKLIQLDYESQDDYGIVPSNFQIDSFPACNYFIDVIDHNGAVWINLNNYEEVRQFASPESGEDYEVIEIKHKDNGRRYFVFVSKQEGEDFKKIRGQNIFCATDYLSAELDKAGITAENTLMTNHVYYNNFC